MKPLPLVQLQPEDFFSEETPLRKPCETIIAVDGPVKENIAALVATFHSHKIAVGLAAPQVGIQKRVCVINISKNKTAGDKLLINPKITKQSLESETRFESCMSLPHIRGQVERFLSVTVEYEDDKGRQQQLQAEGFLARVLQHEIDHLNGVLYVDRISSPKALESTDIFEND